MRERLRKGRKLEFPSPLKPTDRELRPAIRTQRRIREIVLEVGDRLLPPKRRQDFRFAFRASDECLTCVQAKDGDIRARQVTIETHRVLEKSMMDLE